jgi:hypothetical protein
MVQTVSRSPMTNVHRSPKASEFFKSKSLEDGVSVQGGFFSCANHEGSRTPEWGPLAFSHPSGQTHSVQASSKCTIERGEGPRRCPGLALCSASERSGGRGRELGKAIPTRRFSQGRASGGVGSHTPDSRHPPTLLNIPYPNLRPSYSGAMLASLARGESCGHHRMACIIMGWPPSTGCGHRSFRGSYPSRRFLTSGPRKSRMEIGGSVLICFNRDPPPCPALKMNSSISHCRSFPFLVVGVLRKS